MGEYEKEKAMQEYVTLFMRLSEVSNKIIEPMFQAIEKIKSVYPFDEIKKSENAINFQFLDFIVCIELEICASKKVGFIKWYRIHQNLESKRQKTLIIINSFDELGNIKTSLELKMKYDVAKAGIYFFNTLIDFCKKNDESEFNKNLSTS